MPCHVCIPTDLDPMDVQLYPKGLAIDANAERPKSRVGTVRDACVKPSCMPLEPVLQACTI